LSIPRSGITSEHRVVEARKETKRTLVGFEQKVTKRTKEDLERANDADGRGEEENRRKQRNHRKRKQEQSAYVFLPFFVSFVPFC
jgi:hypothetical protein